MKWHKIEVDITRSCQEELLSYLMDRGAGGIQITDPDEVREYISALDTYEYASDELIPDGIDGDVRLTCYFDFDIDHGLLLKELKKLFFNGVRNILHSEVQDGDWADNWKKYYTGFDIGSRLTVKPAWETTTYVGSRTVILMDPKMAFGSGEHETTYMCLQLLDEMDLNGKKVLDVGTGSGILAIAAIKLGAGSAVALDIDQTAVFTAAENAAENNVGDRILVERKEISQVHETGFDIVIANIVADVLIDIRKDIKKRVKTGGIIILSGIINDKKQSVRGKFEQEGFLFVKEKIKNEWSAMVFDA